MKHVRRIAGAFLASDGVRRALWTLAQAGVAIAITESANLPVAYAAPVALVLSAAKSYVARKAVK